MKIERIPPIQPKYKLELTEEEVILLGLLSYGLEGGGGKRFYEVLDDDLRSKIKGRYQGGRGYVFIEHDWSKHDD